MIRPTRRCLHVAIAAVVVLAGLYVGASRSPYLRGSVGDAARPTTPNVAHLITAPVERRPLVEDVSVSGRVHDGKVGRRKFACDSRATDVVTNVSQELDIPLGSVIATIQGDPVVVLAGRFAWYRELSENDTGPDAAQLNAALLGIASERVTASTLAAFSRIVGAKVPVKRISECSLVAVPADSRRIRANVQVGQEARRLAVEYRRGGAYLTVSVPGRGASRVKRGTTFHADGLGGRVTSIEVRGGRIRAEIALDDRPSPGVRQVTGTLSISGDRRRRLIVPASAVYEAARGDSYVLHLKADTSLARIPVRVIDQSDGYIAITTGPGARLVDGDKVLVGPTPLLMDVVDMVGIRKKFGSNVVLDDVSLRVRPGESVAVLGKSGAGKSTLLGILGLLMRAEEGTYKLGGRDVAALSVAERASLRGEQIGFVFQQFHLLRHHTVETNIDVPLRYSTVPHARRRHLIDDALARVGLEQVRTQKARTLSGGEQQRVAIARAMIRTPRLLLCDEPTGNLDSENSRAIVDLLLDHTDGGGAVVMITHDERVAGMLGRQLRLSGGRVSPA